MPLDIQFNLKKNPLYIKYLREHSYWYKIIIRNPKAFNTFLEEVKEHYGLRPTDKINRIFSTINLVSNMFENMV